MGYLRHVICQNEIPFVMNIVINDDSIAFRLLSEINESVNVATDAVQFGVEKLLTTEQLSFNPAAFNINDKTFLVDGKEYAIYSELVFNRDDATYNRLLVPGAHFCFWLDLSRHPRLCLDVRGTMTYFNQRNTAELIKAKGGLWLFDFWIRNPEDSFKLCNRSITTSATTKLITNIEDLGEEWAAEDVMTGTTSKWLNLAYELMPDKTEVEPEGWVTFTLKVLDGKTKELATDVTYDGYIIEAVDGYAPHKRVSVNSGVGTFKVKALGLEDGDKMRVKINQRFYTSRVESTVDVVSPT